jgi:ribosome biogenesis GTPase / thiamine phosphate phosphatase
MADRLPQADRAVDDCTHESEPGCAVRAALEDGRLASERFSSYRKLMRGLVFGERRRDARLQAEERARWRKFHRDMRGALRER